MGPNKLLSQLTYVDVFFFLFFLFFFFDEDRLNFLLIKTYWTFFSQYMQGNIFWLRDVKCVLNQVLLL